MTHEPNYLAIANILAGNVFRDLQSVQMAMHREKRDAPTDDERRSILNTRAALDYAMQCIRKFEAE